MNSDMLGINERNMHFVYRWNKRKFFPLADDKILCKKVLHRNNIACAKTYAVISRVGDIQRTLQELTGITSIAIKPANGSGGGGILILKKNERGQWMKGNLVIDDDKIFTHMAQILMGMYSFGSTDRVLIEECIIPHSFFAEIYPTGVPDFRVILLQDQPIMSMLRIPTAISDGKANLHQGGLGIGINMKEGVLKEAFDGKNYHTKHPDNDSIILGKKIPDWNSILTLSIACSKAFPLDYLGVDIVIDENLGPLIMEINVRPGLGIQLANKQGLKSLLKSKNRTAHYEN